MRILLDRRVLLDMTTAPSGRDGMLQLKVMIECGDAEVWTTSRSFAEFCREAERALGSSRARSAMEETLAWLRVCPVGESDIRAALSAEGGPFEHRLDVACARQIGADYLATADPRAADGPTLAQGTVLQLMEHVAEKIGVRYSVVGL